MIQKKSRKTKTILYLMLAALTVVYAYLSFTFYENDLEDRTTPQIMRAIVQVSRLLPQLEENEQAIHEVYDDLENSRRLVYENHEGALEKDKHDGTDDDAIINRTLSWMNRVITLRVGRRGHVIVISKEDNTILAHTDEQFVGEPVRAVGKVDLGAVPDISDIDPENASDDFHAYFPAVFFKEHISPKRFYAAADAGIYGAAFAYKDTYILCGVTLYEAIVFVIVRTILAALIFFLITWVFVRYIGFSFVWLKEDAEAFRGRLTAYGVICVVLLFTVTWYYQTIMDVTGDIATMNDHAESAVETLNTYRKYRDELSEWLDEQYLEQCRLAVSLVKGKGKENLTRQDLRKYSGELGVEYIYVYDRYGKVLVTDSPYDHFVLSNNEEDQSYAFRPLLDGREYVIQAPQKDDAGGKNMQYIGISLRDREDLADGFVQIAVEPGLRERLLASINVQTVLDNLVIGLPDYALAIDKETMQIAATTGMGFEKANVEELGIDAENIKKGFNEFFVIQGVTYYAGVSESEDMFLVPLVRSTDNRSAFHISLMLTVFGAVTLIVIIVTALYAYKRIFVLKETESEAADTPEAEREETHSDRKDDKRRLLHRLKDIIGAGYKWGFKDRWKEFDHIPIEQQTPGMRSKTIIFRILLVFSVALILFVAYSINMGTRTSSLDGFSYVLLGDWERGVNLFSFSYCLFLLCVLYVFREFLNRIIYRMATLVDERHETILRLLMNALKYGCALIFLYLGLAKFGINTQALLASAGVLSLMVGFGAKDLVSDIIAGLFIIFEGTYKVGDFVLLGNWCGTVQEIGLRSTRFTYYSETKVLNNSAVRDLTNLNGEVAREVLRIPIPYETDLLEIEKLLERELPEMAKNVEGLVKPPEYKGVNSFDDRCIMLRICIYTVPWACRSAYRDMLRQFKLLFDREHINIPYSHMVVMDYKDEENTYSFAPKQEEA